MQTVIVRLNAPSGDGQLHGLVEVVGRRTSETFADDEQLLGLLHDARRAPANQRNSDDPDEGRDRPGT